MTNKPMLSVELRALLNNCADYMEGSASGKVQLWHKELRALLDKPAKVDLVECDACPASGGCVSICMKAPKPAAQYQGHAIPQWLRNHFSWIEDDAMKLGGCGVFTQMRTKVQAYFEMVRGEPMSDQTKTPGPMVLVPREATRRMIEAAIGVYEKDGSYAEMFAAMYDAAPAEIDLTPRRLAHAETVIEQQNNLIASLRAELVDSQGEPVTLDFEAAAQKVASCMDYPWDHMPDQGRCAMREHAKAIVSAAISTGVEQAAPVVDRSAVRDAVAAALGDAYDCTRVWAAWGVGTMSEDDFQLVAEDDERLDEIVEAALVAAGLAVPS